MLGPKEIDRSKHCWHSDKPSFKSVFARVIDEQQPEEYGQQTLAGQKQHHEANHQQNSAN